MWPTLRFTTLLVEVHFPSGTLVPSRNLVVAQRAVRLIASSATGWSEAPQFLDRRTLKQFFHNLQPLGRSVAKQEMCCSHSLADSSRIMQSETGLSWDFHGFGPINALSWSNPTCLSPTEDIGLFGRLVQSSQAC